ncbi:MAG: response regulator [Anaeromyxobacteraceae bacterium]|nr:response regulator [Anaeromyxobacteraceae bacterium]
MGLATVYGIVDEPKQAAPAGVAGEAPRGHETRLPVEDSEPLQEMIRETLEESGYTVLLASNRKEALALARGSEGPIDLLLTDVVMPKLGGADLAKLLVALRPGLRVLYMPGYTEGAISQHGVLGEGVMLLEKPFIGGQAGAGGAGGAR